uniref:Sulfotransferase n=1 Tax=Aquila chrysaetos chrysaetos TaxID=223781 RepID=A0A663EDH8_AQUCH
MGHRPAGTGNTSAARDPGWTSPDGALPWTRSRHGIQPVLRTWRLPVEAFQVRPADLLIATNPKSGTTWLSKILDEIYHDGDVEKCQWDAIVNRVPFLERKAPKMSSGIEMLEKTLSPQLVKTHLLVQLLLTSFWDKNCHLHGPQPQDVIFSHYYFYQMAKMHPDPSTLGEFLETFMVGKVAYGSLYKHVQCWWEKKQEEQLLYLFYEDMKKDPRQGVQKILHFLGKEVVEGTMARMLHHTSLQEMRKNPAADYETMPTTLMDHRFAPLVFLPPGITGDWKNHFTVAQNKHFDQHYQEHMAGSNLDFQMEA